jgi:hypothetical protein
LPRKAREGAAEAEEEPALALALAVAARAECQEAVAPARVDLAPAEVRGPRVHLAAFGSLAVVVPALEGVWGPVTPRVEEQAVVRVADQVVAPEAPADTVVDLVEVAVAAGEELGLAGEAPALAAALVAPVGLGKLLESGSPPRHCFAVALLGVAAP